MPLSFSTLFRGVIGNRCPRCLQGRVFSGWFAMNARCPQCGLRFAREPGYFLGATVAAYFLASFSVIPLLVGLIFLGGVEVGPAIGAACLQVVLLTPLLFRFSRLVWLFVERRMTLALDGRDWDEDKDKRNAH